MQKQFLVLDFKTSESADLTPKLGETIRDNFEPNTYVLCNFLPVYGPQLGYYAQRNLRNNVVEYRHWQSFLKEEHDQILHLLRHMPVPFVLSSENATVLFINEQASKMLNVTDKEARGTQFFSLLEDVTEKKGSAVGRYLSVFDLKSSEELVSKFRPCANKDTVLNGCSILVENAGLRRMVTVISTVKDE